MTLNGDRDNAQSDHTDLANTSNVIQRINT
jgi:hypothetical protein